MAYVLYTVHLLYSRMNIMIIKTDKIKSGCWLVPILFLIIPHYFSGDFSSFWRIVCLSIKISSILTSKNVLRKTHKKYHKKSSPSKSIHRYHTNLNPTNIIPQLLLHLSQIPNPPLIIPHQQLIPIQQLIRHIFCFTLLLWINLVHDTLPKLWYLSIFAYYESFLFLVFYLA